jgi:phospholipid/cholesterol/gamma-HCH transport system substrate-binding protein
VIIITYFIYIWVEERERWEERYMLWALFSDASGLVRKTPVRIAGIPVGNVKQLEFFKGKVKVKLEIDSSVHIYQDAIIAKRLFSILGEYYLEIIPGTPKKGRLKPGSQIMFVSEIHNVELIQRDIDIIVHEIKKIVHTLGATFASPQKRGRIAQVLENFNKINITIHQIIAENTKIAGHTKELIDNLIKSEAPLIRQTQKDIKNIIQNIKDLIIRKKIDQKEFSQLLDRLLKDLNLSVQRLKQIFANLNLIKRNINKGKGNIGKAISNEILIDEVKGLVTDTRELTQSFARLETIVGLRSEYNFFIGRFKNYVELQLKPAEDKYYLVEIIDDPRGKTSIIEVYGKTGDPKSAYKFRRVITKTAPQVFKFSFQFAKKLGPCIFRFGFKESTGGVGVNLNLFQQRLRLKMDLFGFGVNVYPRLKTLASFEFFHRLYILGGIDDVFNRYTRDLFIGLKLKFTDKDLKTILSMTPITTTTR